MNKGIVFLDRDGTINIDTGYITDPAKIKLFDGVSGAIGALKRANYSVVIVTNQSAIGRGMAPEADVIATNKAVCRLLVEGDPDAIIDQVLYSPDPPGQTSQTRKPATGMIEQLHDGLEYRAEQCWVCGDKMTDVQFGLNAGMSPTSCLLLRTGAGEEELTKLSEEERQKVLVFPSLVEAAEHIVSF